MRNWLRRVSHWAVLESLWSVVQWGILKILGGFFVGLGITIWALLSHLPLPIVITVGILAFAGTVWAINGISWRTERSRLREVIQASSRTEGEIPSPPSNLTADSHTLSSAHLKGLSFRIVDLAREHFVIEHRVFEDCVIYGPAMLAIYRNVQMLYCTFDGIGYSFLFDLPGRRYITGPIVLDDCIFRRCRFVRIGLIGHTETIEEWKKNITLVDR